MSGWSEADIPDLSGRRILVTGGASGIGLEAARALAEHGAEILIADRNEIAGRAALGRIREGKPDARVQFRALDLGSLAAVSAFATEMLEEGRSIDVLINNAGIQPIAERRVSADGFELAFGIGHLGHFALTARLMPLLRASPDARIVTVSSLVHGNGRFDWDDLQMEKGYEPQRAYSQTKLANLLFARELQRRLDANGVPIRSIAVHPGVARTSIGKNRKELGAFRFGDHVVTTVLSLVMPVLGQPAAAGALPTMFAASAPEAQGGGFYGPNGFGGMKGAPVAVAIKPAGQDLEAARRLWSVSEKLTGITWQDAFATKS